MTDTYDWLLIPKMAPGQTPYTPEEWQAVQRLISEAFDDEITEDQEWMYRELPSAS